MTDRPIIFCPPMICAHLAGRKTMTRRVLKPQPHFETFVPSETLEDLELRGFECEQQEDDGFRIAKVPYAPSDRLWVRETLRFDWTINAWRYDADKAICTDVVGAELETPTPSRWPLGVCTSMFMPRRLSRLTDIVESVKVERLGDISEDDTRAEGLRCLSKDQGRTWKWGLPEDDGMPGASGWQWQMWRVGHHVAFAQLWDSLHGPDAWAANPWVAAPSFRVIKANIDTPEVAP